MSETSTTRVLVTKAVLWAIVGIGAAVAAVRFARGLGVTTALTDATPWGLWIGFDVLGGVALAAGGFVIAAAVYIFRLEKYHPIVRPAVLTAFLGYVAVVLGLLMDLGRPWNIWRPMFFWQPDSPLFEVAWCVMLYLTVLALEFAPVVFEGLRWPRALRAIQRVTLVLVVAGIGLSTLHQSSLGTLFLLARDRVHPLWWTPLLPLLFFISAVALGLVMVTTESLTTSWLYRREPEWPLLRGLTRAAAVVMGLYLLVRLGDLAWRGVLPAALDGSWIANLFLVELALSAVVPIVLFTVPAARRRPGLLGAGALMGVAGFVLHRIDVGGISHLPATGQSYLPALTEIVVSCGVVAGMALIFLFFVEHLPVWEHPPAQPDHFAPPVADPVSRAYFGGRWFGATHLGAVSLTVGLVLGLLLLEVSPGRADGVRPEPVRPALSVLVARADLEPGPLHDLRLASPEGTPGEPRPALLVDGDRAGAFTLFEHQAHQERLGGQDSCGRCHHRNLPLDRATPCSACHRDMYAVTDTFDHEVHVHAFGDNAGCVRCHPAGAGKARAVATACDECHARQRREEAGVPAAAAELAGYAPGYRFAMHGLCAECHARWETEHAMEPLTLSRCTACHRDRSVLVTESDGSPAVPRLVRLEHP